MKKIQFKAVDGIIWTNLHSVKTLEDARDFISKTVGEVRSGFSGYRYEVREIDEFKIL